MKNINNKEEILKKFYTKFKENTLYYIIMVLIILTGLLFNPFSDLVFNLFDKGPFVACPYIMLSLMFVVCLLYRNVFLYVFTVVLFTLSLVLSYIGVAMGSRNESEVIYFFLPIILLFLLNLIIAVITHKYK